MNQSEPYPLLGPVISQLSQYYEELQRYEDDMELIEFWKEKLNLPDKVTISELLEKVQVYREESR